MSWGKIKIYLGNYSNSERGMLLLLFSFYFILFFTKDIVFGLYVAWLAWAVSTISVFGLIFRAINFNKNILLLDGPVAEMGRKAVSHFWRMNSLLLVFPWFGMLISSMVISGQSSIYILGRLFSYIAFIAFVGVMGSIIYFVILVLLGSSRIRS